MNRFIFIAVCLVFPCHGRRVQSAVDLGLSSLAQVNTNNRPLSRLASRLFSRGHLANGIRTESVDSEERWASQMASAAGTDLEGIFKLRGGFLGSLVSKFRKPEAKYKVCVVGGAGGIGQPLSLAMAQHPLVKELSIIDLDIAAVPVPGVAADLSHVEGATKVTSTVLSLANKDRAIDKAADSLTGCQVVLVPAGVPRKPGQDRKDLLTINADIAKGTVEACAKYCPDAVIGLIVNPVNSIVPAMSALWEKAGLDPKNVVGITSLDCVRSNKFVQERMGKVPDVTVIGGHAGKTILPLLSQDSVANKIPEAEIVALDERIQNAGTEVVKEKAGKGSATLSMAYAAARWAGAVMRGLNGKPTTECAYVKSSIVPELPYFASKVVFGKGGVQEVLPIGTISAYEQARLDELIPILKGEIDEGLDYAATTEFAK